MTQAMEDSEPVVAIVMSRDQPPAIVPFATAPMGFAHRGETFTKLPLDAWLGFYDWLRSEGGDIVGLYLFYLHSSALDLDHLRGLKGVTIEGGPDVPEVLILVAPSAEFDRNFHSEGLFGGNHLYRGEEGSIAVTFVPP